MAAHSASPGGGGPLPPNNEDPVESREEGEFWKVKSCCFDINAFRLQQMKLATIEKENSTVAVELSIVDWCSQAPILDLVLVTPSAGVEDSVAFALDMGGGFNQWFSLKNLLKKAP